jgi:hypothetical protein
MTELAASQRLYLLFLRTGETENQSISGTVVFAILTGEGPSLLPGFHVKTAP